MSDGSGNRGPGGNSAVNGKAGHKGDRAGPAWADRLIEESVERIETWRERAASSTDIGVSKEEAEKTHAVMLSVLELMELNRASLREMALRGGRSTDCDRR